jgi:formylglycine-generating enzyme required for sulfatase activity/tetratricopeptide (TPR) repeat protein
MGPRFEDLLDEVRSLEKRDGTRRDSHRSSSTRFAGSPSTIGRYLVLECLGEGAFGRVYQAWDEELERIVAIKVPRPGVLRSSCQSDTFLDEARMAAQLRHPAIIAVHDVGRKPDGDIYIVMDYVEGKPLAALLNNVPLPVDRLIGWLARVAEALHHAHKVGLVHRDLKPTNILVDGDGNPYVVDFGLAVHEEVQRLRSGEIAGSASYMAPEQVRGETHRLDGRTDVWALGVILYRILTGRMPFTGSINEIFDEICNRDPKPPRQINDAVPKELERVCLKCLAKRMSDRYNSALDLADDLHHYLRSTATAELHGDAADASMSAAGSALQTTAATRNAGGDSGPGLANLVPKGLRSFDEHDADFFLELLPGARDRDRLPESIRFWKTRIEERDPDEAFRVGLIYGASGCGKSSLVKAGLIPRLARDVRPIHIETTADNTEERLLRYLHKTCPELSGRQGLSEAITLLRSGRILPRGQKVVAFLDQFEQWLFARRGETDTELVAALRQCDGQHVQAVIMVRDDFWLAVSRFMAALEIDLLQGQNTALVDLFDPRHARKVLTALGIAYGALPQRASDLSNDQHAFLDHAIAELAQDGKVVSVRLALFAEMLKGKPWTPVTLREVGGTAGVGVAFLEETFRSPQANPKHRTHQGAARAVLAALLPEAGADIKGQMRSQAELLEASGYAGRPRAFADLMHMLDHELRLITPTEAEGVEGGVWRVEGADSLESPSRTTAHATATAAPSPAPAAPLLPKLSPSPATHHPSPATRYYQLTHDYLVHSLRDWITRKKRESRRGRAELRLAEQAALWRAKPEDRHLPSILEWAEIRALTPNRNWTAAERRVMSRAGRYHGVRALGLAAVAALLTMIGLNIRTRVLEANQAIAARGLVQQIISAHTAKVPEIIRRIGASDRRWTDRELREIAARSSETSKEKLHASLALLQVDPLQAEFLYERLLSADPNDLLVIRDALDGHRGALVERLWSVLRDARANPERRFRSGCALAGYASQQNEPRWSAVSTFLADTLLASVTKSPSDYAPLLELLRPIRERLLASLSATFRNAERPEVERSFATSILADYASDQPALLTDSLLDADHEAYLAFFPMVQQHAAITLPLLRAEVARQRGSEWDDPPRESSWAEVDSALKTSIESARGLVYDQFAFCQTMTLAEFLTVAEGLRNSGYRPIRVRPYGDAALVRVAAVWKRDGRNWQLAYGQTANQVNKQNELNEKKGLVPVDVAAYVTTSPEGERKECFAIVWAEKIAFDGEVQLFTSLSDSELCNARALLEKAGMAPIALGALRGSDGRTRYCGLWQKSPRRNASFFRGELGENALRDEILRRLQNTLIDLSIGPAAAPPDPRERAAAELKKAQAALDAKPGDAGAKLALAKANFELGEYARAIEELNLAVQKAPRLVKALQLRAIAHARLGNRAQARADLASVQKGNSDPTAKLCLSVVIAAELEEGASQAMERLETALARQPEDTELTYNAACAYSVASQVIRRKDAAQGQILAGRALKLLRAAIDSGYANYQRMQRETSLDPIRGLPDFVEIMKSALLDRSYAAVWTASADLEAKAIVGLDPITHVRRCVQQEAQGYRMVSISLARIAPDQPPVATSVWHRPVTSEQIKDRRAQRQARAAIALVRLGKVDEVVQTLRYSSDPRLRSYIINWLSPLGADPVIVTGELERIGNGDGGATARLFVQTAALGEVHHRSGERISTSAVRGEIGPEPAVHPKSVMDAVLFHPDTSIRRALIVALGTYGPEAISTSAREILVARFLDLYRADPDAGIHSAVKWTLGQWGHQRTIAQIDDRLAKANDWTGRRWFINSQRQTFAVIDDSVEFRIGSPPIETDRFRNEAQHLRRIPYRFAIGTDEVTVEQFLQFAKQNPAIRLQANDKYSPVSTCPMNQLTWYEAAAYCNWLSVQEGLAPCYEPNWEGEFAEGMKIVTNFLARTGYRLPTEDEWEYACRAQSVTSRYFGESPQLLSAYAWFIQNSGDRARPCGLLEPNELGLFDTLGNVVEWCQNRATARPPGGDRIEDTNRELSETVADKIPRVLRGGTFGNQPATVHSANRSPITPASRNSVFGFRLVRTCN